jgi:predicted MFS family arabinose efflux permease
MCATATISNLAELLALRLTVGIGKVIVMSMTNLIVAVLFRRNFALALGLVSAGWHLGGIVFPPIAQNIIATYGWRTAAVSLGLLVLVTNVPLLRVTLGTLPSFTSSNSGAAADTDHGPLKQTSTPPLWSILLLTLLFYGCYSFVFVNISAILQEGGLSRSQSVNLLSVMALSAFFGVIVTGRVLNQLPTSARLISVFAFFILQLISIAGVLHSLNSSIAFTVLFLITFGVMVGGADVAWISLLRNLGKSESFPKLFSAWYFTQLVGLFSGPTLGGWINDHVGSYVATLHVVAGSSLASTVLMLALISFLQFRTRVALTRAG